MPASGCIDCHAHHYSAEVLADPLDWGKANHEHLWLACVAPTDRPSLQDWVRTDQLLAAMDADGIERTVLQSWYWEQAATVRAQNDFLSDCLRSHSDRLSAFAALPFAEGTAAVLAEAQRALKAGFNGFGELHPGVNALHEQPATWDALAEFAAKAQVPLLVHVTEPVGARYPGRVETPLDLLLNHTCAHPETTYILAHLGGLLPIFALNRRLAASFENLYFDLAAAPLLYEPRICRTMVDCVGAERLLFGTDYPLRVAPSKRTHADFATTHAWLHRAGLDATTLIAITQDNARRLLHLPE
ncbi:MAG: amidohydrolase family protein [Opitutales bacterium]